MKRLLIGLEGKDMLLLRNLELLRDGLQFCLKVITLKDGHVTIVDNHIMSCLEQIPCWATLCRYEEWRYMANIMVVRSISSSRKQRCCACLRRRLWYTHSYIRCLTRERSRWCDGGLPLWKGGHARVSNLNNLSIICHSMREVVGWVQGQRWRNRVILQSERINKDHQSTRTLHNLAYSIGRNI